MTTFLDRALRLVLTLAHSILKATRPGGRPNGPGAHAIALTPQGRIVLVKLRYAPGWFLPGGGRAKDEDTLTAALRELSEEIGLKSHGPVTLLSELEHSDGQGCELDSLIIVRDVGYRARRWNLEVEKVGEFDLESLPAELSEPAGRWIEAVRRHL